MFSNMHGKNTWLIDAYTSIHNMCLHMRVPCARRKSLARRLCDHLQKSRIKIQMPGIPGISSLCKEEEPCKEAM